VQVASLYDTLEVDTMQLKLFLGMNVCRTRAYPEVLRVMQEGSSFGKRFSTRGKGKFSLGVFSEFLGQGLATIDDGEEYKGLRTIMNPAFRKTTTDQMVESFVGVARNTVSMLEDAGDGTVDMQQVAMAATMDSIGRLHLKSDMGQVDLIRKSGSDAGGGPLDLSKLLKNITQNGQASLFFFQFGGRTLASLTPAYKDFKRMIGELDDMTAKIIADRKAMGLDGADDADALGALLRAQEHEEWLTNDLIRDQVVTLFFAGSDTTASTVAWTLYEMAKQPDMMRRIQAEVDGAAGRDPKDLETLPLLNGAISETLRMYPPAPLVSRDIMQDSIIDGCFIPAGSVIALDIYALHHDQKLWHDPDHWYPPRWTDDCEPIYKPRHPDALVPFASGQRACIGRYFALREAQVFLATLLGTFDFAPSEIEPQLIQALTIQSTNGINLNISKRK